MPFSISGTEGIVATPTLNAGNVVASDISGNLTGNVTANTVVTNALTAINNIITPPGTILQAVYTESSTVQEITQANIAAITNLETTITPRRNNSKFLLQAGIANNGRYVSSFGFMRKINNVWTAFGGNNNTNSTNAIATTYFGSDLATNFYHTSYNYLHTPSYTLGESLIYTAAATSSWSTDSVRTIIINDRQSGGMRSTSTLVIFEIAA